MTSPFIGTHKTCKKINNAVSHYSKEKLPECKLLVKTPETAKSNYNTKINISNII